MSRRRWIKKYVRYQEDVTASIVNNIDVIEKVVDVIDLARKTGKRIFVAGNGGSLANASHFAQDLGKGSSDAISSDKRFKIAALDNSSWITALGNDYNYDRVFVDQLATVAEAGDVFIGISVSGTSRNILEAMVWARDNNITGIALVGNRFVNSSLSSITDVARLVIMLDDKHFGRVEDSIMTVLHIISYYFIERIGGLNV